jgi:hypothetical protein
MSLELSQASSVLQTNGLVIFVHTESSYWLPQPAACQIQELSELLVTHAPTTCAVLCDLTSMYQYSI